VIDFNFEADKRKLDTPEGKWNIEAVLTELALLLSELCEKPEGLSGHISLLHARPNSLRRARRFSEI
jgi:hypothetical protein